MIKIGTLAKKSGVSVRTLRYYEEIDLLIPSEILESGYRIYSDADAMRLQQIMFYKELDYSLSNIKEILGNKDFDLLSSLENQRKVIEQKKDLYSKLISTINNTINELKKGRIMNIDELYEGFPESKEYREEALANWGENVRQAESKLMRMSKNDFKKLNDGFMGLWRELSKAIGLPPDSERVQSLISQHRAYICTYWGVDDITDDQYLGLAELYVQDKNYTTIDGVEHPEMGKFLKRAMNHYLDKL